MSGRNWRAGPWLCKAAEGKFLSVIADEAGKIFAVFKKSPSNADLALIASAPELYEALDSLLGAIDSCTELTPELLRECEKTLSKARGEL